MNENEIVLDSGPDSVMDALTGLSDLVSEAGQAADLASGSESIETVSSGDPYVGNVQAPGSSLPTVPEVQTVQMVSSGDPVPDYSDSIGHIDYLLISIELISLHLDMPYREHR